jgi:hypothetical protein
VRCARCAILAGKQQVLMWIHNLHGSMVAPALITPSANPRRKEGFVPEPSAIEGVLRALVEAMEAKEAAEPDLPEWEANARLRDAEASLLRLYRESGRNHPQRVAIDIEVVHSSVGPTAVEVA